MVAMHLNLQAQMQASKAVHQPPPSRQARMQKEKPRWKLAGRCARLEESSSSPPSWGENWHLISQPRLCQWKSPCTSSCPQSSSPGRSRGKQSAPSRRSGTGLTHCSRSCATCGPWAASGMLGVCCSPVATSLAASSRVAAGSWPTGAQVGTAAATPEAQQVRVRGGACAGWTQGGQLQRLVPALESVLLC